MKTHPIFSARKYVFLLACLCCLLWGSSFPSVKTGYALFAIGHDDLPAKMLFAGYRFVFAGGFLVLVALAMGRSLAGLGGKRWSQITLLGLTQTSLQYVFFYIGIGNTTGVKASVLNATGTFFSVLLAHFIYKNDRLSWGRALGCLVGFVGVMVVNFSHSLLDFHFTLLGEGFIVVAAFVLAAASIYGRKISQSVDAIVLTGLQLGIGGAALALGGYAAGGELSGWSWKSGALLGYLALVSSVAFGLWTILLKYNRVGMVTVFNFLVPIFGAILSALFLGENILEWKNVIALVLVCSGIFLVTREVRSAS